MYNLRKPKGGKAKSSLFGKLYFSLYLYIVNFGEDSKLNELKSLSPAKSYICWGCDPCFAFSSFHAWQILENISFKLEYQLCETRSVHTSTSKKNSRKG